MSAASFDPQRSKGHASKMQNGSLHQKENVHDNDFEPYLTGQSTQSNSYPSMTDPYLPSYYAPSIGFPYPLSEAPWSTGGDPPIPYLTPYGPLSNGDHHFLPDGVFGQPGALGSSVYPHRFNFFPENPAFSAWGPAAAAAAGSQGQQTSGSAYGGSYNYPPSSLGGTLVPDGQTGFHGDALNKAPGMNSLDQGMLGLKIGSGGGDIMGGQGSGLKAVGSAIGGPALQPTGNGALPSGGAPPSKPASWAAIAGKPAKPPQVKLMRLKPGAALPPPIKHNMNVGTWDKGPAAKAAPGQMAPPPHLHPHQQPPPLGPPHAGLAPQPMGPPPMQPLTLQPHHHHHHHHHPHPHHPQPPPPPQPYQTHLHGPPPPPQTRWVAPRNRNPSAGYGPGLEGCGGGGAMVPVGNNGGGGGGGGGGGAESHPVLEKLCAAHGYNPREFEWNLKHGRVFIIKSYSEDDVHRSIKYSIWCSTEHGNKRLDGAFRGARGPVYLLFSVNGSGHFCGVAEMRSPVDYGASAGVWAQDKWKGKFDVAWLFVKDVPNGQLRHVRLENNDNKPVTNSRDTQEVPLDKARQVLRIMASYRHTTSIFDDFSHYERRQEEEEEVRKTFEPAPIPSRSRLDQERQNRSKQ